MNLAIDTPTPLSDGECGLESSPVLGSLHGSSLKLFHSSATCWVWWARCSVCTLASEMLLNLELIRFTHGLRWLVWVSYFFFRISMVLNSHPSFIFWAMAYLTMYPGHKKWAGPLRSAETLLNYFFILLGAYITVAGTYVGTHFEFFRLIFLSLYRSCRQAWNLLYSPIKRKK